ncbi:MAG: DUF1906 domain-containing protein [Acetobacteraceae bacterium]|nr:DUF1906 domain-containing protein [Pseudomonadota bacterium]
MAQPCGTHQLSGIPPAQVDRVMQQYIFSNPTSVSKREDDDGTFTVTAVFPPCVDTAASPAAPTAGASFAHAISPALTLGANLKRGFDSNRDCSGLINKISAANVEFVARYYSHNHAKNISPGEAKLLSGAGIEIVAVWESAGNHASFFTRAQGVDDATSAHNQAMGIGQPPGTPIYFAVDFDASVAELNGGIIPYFQGVAAGLTTIGHGAPAYAIGVYGSGLVCGRLSSLGLVTHTWLSMSSGWAGSKTYTDWNIRQHLEGDPFGFGFSVDPDDARDDYGGFRVAVLTS